MEGTITTRHLFTRAPTIIRQFGLAAYARCIGAAVFSRRPVTFLECVVQCCDHKECKPPESQARS